MEVTLPQLPNSILILKEKRTGEAHKDKTELKDNYRAVKVDSTSARTQRGLCLSNSKEGLKLSLGPGTPLGIMVGCDEPDKSNSNSKPYSSYYPISAFDIFQDYKLVVWNINIFLKN